MLAIHIAMYQRDILDEGVALILQANPSCAQVPTKELSLIPLFYAVMRDNASYSLVKLLCDVYPDGVKHKNKTNSLPLHFACKRRHPNYSIVKLLVNRYPGGLLCQNSYSWHPLHCLCSSTDDLKIIKFVHESCPDTLQIQDRQGRTCLHLATLLIGKDHQNAVSDVMMSGEEEDGDNNELKNLFATNASTSSSAVATSALSSQLKKISLVGKSNGDVTGSQRAAEREYDSEDIQEEQLMLQNERTNNINETQELGGFHRKALHYLVQHYPLSLLIPNNFQATPVDTVLEKVNNANKSKSKYKHVVIWGLYDDPVTARILLSYQKQFFLKRAIPRGLKLQQIKILCELNWINRRSAMLASYGNHVNSFVSGGGGGSKTKLVIGDAPEKTGRSGAGGRHRTGKSASATKSEGSNNGKSISSSLSKQPLLLTKADSANVLFRLRIRGHEDCIKLAISFI